MIEIRPASQRGGGDHGWLKTRHTFSFGDYYDPRHMGFRSLRVINEDIVQPGQGFGEHPHRDMEIVTYVLEGALAHSDSMGHIEVLGVGEFQRMSAGAGITHSEFNASDELPVHFYQIWLVPEKKGIEPSYEQKRFAEELRRNRLQLVASPDAAAGSLLLHQDARIFLSTLDDGSQIQHQLPAGRQAWLQVLRGAVALNEHDLQTGDGAAIGAEPLLTIRATSAAEVMLFDLA